MDNERERERERGEKEEGLEIWDTFSGERNGLKKIHFVNVQLCTFCRCKRAGMDEATASSQFS